MLRNVTVNVDSLRRIVLHPEGGVDLQAYDEQFGWVCDNGADVSDALLVAYLHEAVDRLLDSAGKLTPKLSRR